MELGRLGIAVKIVEPDGVTSTNFGRRSGDEGSGPKICLTMRYL